MQTLERELKYINPELIDFDKYNPRGEDRDAILKDPDFKDLVKSINTYGVLEPLIIKKNKHENFMYVLIDGERRLRASKSIPLSEIPVIVAESTSDGKILAYQLHMLRKMWTKIAEVKSVKGIINEIKSLHNQISDKELINIVKDITNAPQKKVKEFICLSLYDDKQIEYVIKKEVGISYLIETEKVLIPKIRKNFPDFKFTEEDIRSIIVKKAKLKILVNESRFLRREKKVEGYQFVDVLDDIISQKILESFFAELKMSISEVIDKYIKLKSGNTTEKSAKTSTKNNVSSPPNKNVPTSTENQGNTIIGPKSGSNGKQQDNGDYAKIILTPQQQTTVKDIQKKFEGKGKTFSEDELKYIQEALKCLNNGCLKAATLMIWAANISRILSFIEKNITQFNTISKDMKDTNVSFCKSFSKNFQHQAKNIEEIRQASMDRQVLCYICYLNIIDITQFDNLKAYYNTRNNCAHPTKVQLKPNEIIGMFENIFEYIFDNPKLV